MKKYVYIIALVVVSGSVYAGETPELQKLHKAISQFQTERLAENFRSEQFERSIAKVISTDEEMIIDAGRMAEYGYVEGLIKYAYGEKKAQELQEQLKDSKK